MFHPVRSGVLKTDTKVERGELPVSEIPHRTVRSLFLVDACRPGAWERVGGIPLAVRILFHLRANELKSGVLFLKGECRLDRYKRWWEGLRVIQTNAPDDIPSAVSPFSGLAERFIYVDAAHLIDPRILERLCLAERTTFVFVGPYDREEKRVRAAFLGREDLADWQQRGAASVIVRADSLYPEHLDPFVKEIRGPVTPYLFEVRSRAEAEKASRLLVVSQQKQVMDFPAEYVDPFFENALTLMFCKTPVTPNVVTFLGVASAAAAAWLFLHGLYLFGALAAFIVEILDGVDGKLARTKLYFSRIGEQEALLDYVCENALYVALGAGLVQSGYGRLPVVLAGLLIFSDTADNVFYTLAEKFYGKSIDLFSPFDASFRRIAGRRNVYTFIFILGFSIGFPIHTLAAASAWAVFTAVMHGVRLFRFGRRRKRVYEGTIEEP